MKQFVMSTPVGALPSSWVRFDERVVSFDDERADATTKLVVQEGRLFQQANPDVEVLVDKGRYLLVAVPPDALGRVTSVEGAYAVADLEQGTTVFQTVPGSAARRTPVPWVQALADAVSAEELKATIDRLAAFPTRLSTSSHYADALAHLRTRLDALGYATSVQDVTVPGGHTQNLVADRPGTGHGARGLVIVTAHLDSVNHAGGPDAPAPGADDNASGCAGVLEMARVLRDHRATHDLRLVLFGGEEQGLHGSRAFVAALSARDRRRLRSVLNLDMVANQNTPAPGVLLEGAAVSQRVIDALAAAAATYTPLIVQTSLHPFNSDHVPFIEAGLPAVLTIEAADGANADAHSGADTADRVEADLAAEIVRMDVAMVAQELGREERDRPVPVAPKFLEHLLPVLRRYSGRYEHNGGATTRVEAPPRDDPSVIVDRPILRPPVVADALRRTRFTLHVDIDGRDPLGVVSGTVARGLLHPPQHFIGRVTSDTRSGSARDLVVEDFAFTWPGTSTTIDRLELRLTRTFFEAPVAEVRFIRSSGQLHAGPYTVEQASRWFREVGVEVDVEDGAVNPEPYNTHTHPDRPADLPEQDLTLENVFARSGVRITRSAPNTISTSAAGSDSRWSEAELHDAMESHWSAFANVPQWKLWIFLAELATDDSLGGIMFDGDIDEPGGVDRQGTAVFTKSPHFHTAGGAYAQANPPAAAAAQRELFFDLIHETGHAFNLAHSFQKQAVFDPGDAAWPAPPWMPLTTEPQALSWMNYPDAASPGSGFGATWFYERFRFRFDDGENLFLRHAPASFVQMGNEAWFHNHGRVERGTLDRRLQLLLRTQSLQVELGQPVFVELRLANVGTDVLLAHRALHPAEGLVELAVTGPDGQRRPFVPFMHPRRALDVQPLAPGERVYRALDLTMGQFGFPFKRPGPYRIEASYTNVDGSTAAAILHLEVLPPADHAAGRAVRELFDARVGRVLTVGGTRTMEDVQDKLDRVRTALGPEHPASYYLSAARALPYAAPFKQLTADTDAVRLEGADPEYVEHELAAVVEEPEPAADALGHITFTRVANVYADAAVEAGQRGRARDAVERVRDVLAHRNVVQPVIDRLDERARELA